MNLWQDVSYGEKAPETVNVIVECPKGRRISMKSTKKTGLIKLDRAMKTGSQDYPFDYGFVPQTLWEDGDALDVVLSDVSLAPGILVDARVVGVMHMVDCGESDDKDSCRAREGSRAGIR